jgi:hypothetical protein
MPKALFFHDRTMFRLLVVRCFSFKMLAKNGRRTPPESKVISGYIEGVENGQTLGQSAREAMKRKPVVLLKAGTTEG